MEVRRPLWVSRMSATPKGWQLTGNNKSQGFFDAVVIAHNGERRQVAVPAAILQHVCSFRGSPACPAGS